MNKKMIAALIALILAVPTTSQAVTSKPVNFKAEIKPATLAILDTALDTSLPIFQGKIIYEVCILEWPSCPNKKNFMEGPGSAVVSPVAFTKSGFEHGTQVASAAIQKNPNIQILFVRIVPQNNNYDVQITTQATFYNALNWVYSNKDKFNIKAISISQGSTSMLVAGTEYCPKTQQTRDSITNLLSAGIPTFTAAGNNRYTDKVVWPACIPQAVTIGAGTENGIAIYSNNDSKVMDFFANGNMQVYTVGNKQVNVAGTSYSAPTAAADWISLFQAKPYLTYQQQYDLFVKTSIQIKGSQGTGKLMLLNGALNG